MNWIQSKGGPFFLFLLTVSTTMRDIFQIFGKMVVEQNFLQMACQKFSESWDFLIKDCRYRNFLKPFFGFLLVDGWQSVLPVSRFFRGIGLILVRLAGKILQTQVPVFWAIF